MLLDRDFGFTDNALVESHNEAGDELARNMLAEKNAALVPCGRYRTAQYYGPSERLLTGPENSRYSPSRVGHRRAGQYAGGRICPDGFAYRQPGCSAGVYRLIVTRSGRAIEALRTRTGTVPQHINIGTFDEHPMLGFLPNSVWSMQQDEDTWRKKRLN